MDRIHAEEIGPTTGVVGQTVHYFCISVKELFPSIMGHLTVSIKRGYECLAITRTTAARYDPLSIARPSYTRKFAVQALSDDYS
jgi:hypothetical protein